ncbi:MAG: transcriptional regulator, partial [Armatimonadetes bacterium]|nr:transcriptional regulator [Armatimonadota bacterium]
SFYMDPPRSPFHGVLQRQGRLIERTVRHFQIETVLNADTFPPVFRVLQKPEHSWSKLEATWFQMIRFGCAVAPFEINWRIWHSVKAPYGVIGIYTGEVESVHEKTLQRLAEQQEVPVKGQSDIVLCGAPYLGPYNVNSVMNPILVHCLTTGYLFNLMSIGKPLLREGGVLIFTHPLYERFHKQHHPSYIDFWNEVLTQTRDPREMEKFEAAFAFNERYISLYR